MVHSVDFTKVIDLRSDTVTKPTFGMLDAMRYADTGDDVYGEDPSVNALEEKMVEITGMDSSIFVPTGTQSNLIALLSHCARGDEYIVGQQGHTYKYEGGGGAVLGGIQPQPLDFEDDGTLDLDKVSNLVKPNDYHFARTRLLCLENTHNGKFLSVEYLRRARDFCREKGLSFHLDGARIFNAAVAQKIQVREITKYFDSVSICLSKGLGAPVGSVLCGSVPLIKRARRWRKVTGGGMRQSGYLAACGLYALENHIKRLSFDHRNADILATLLAEISPLKIKGKGSYTNMVFLKMSSQEANSLTAYLKKNNIKVGGYGEIRLVTHLDVSEEDVLRVVECIRQYYS